jgi:cytochrome oxidase assembly protein ShyY1
VVSPVLSPRAWPFHALVVAAVLAAGWLGWWQYGAWQEHRDAEARDLTHATPIPLDDALGPDDPFPAIRVGQPVRISGTWLADATTYVSGREHDGRDGYWVVTPISVGGAGKPAIPVVRGWVDRPADAPADPFGEAELTAWLQPPESAAPEPDADPGDDVTPTLRVADLLQRVHVDLYGGFAVATEPGAGLAAATLEQLPDAGAFTGLRNLLYGLEWWFFGGFAVYVWVRWMRDELDAQTAAVGSAS